MRKLIMWNMVSLDGMFEAPGHEIDWFVFDDELERYILDTQPDAGTLLFGRRTYELMAGYWPAAEGDIATFMNSVEKVVFSTTLESAGWTNTRLVRENAPEEVSRLKQAPGGDIFIFGSADLVATLMPHGLIDEYRLGLNPVVLGRGTPLFKESPERLSMRLLEARPLGSGLVILHYEPVVRGTT
jgi:dihydrofolate reductase